MPKPTFTEMEAHLDPLQTDFYELLIPDVPGSTVGTTQILRVGCQQFSLPAKQIEQVDKEVAGNQSHYAGRSLVDPTASATFVENRNMDAHRGLRNWQEYIRRHETQTGTYKSMYARRAILNVFDTMGLTVDSFILKGLWIQQLGEVAFDGTGSNIVMLQATFTLDFWEPAAGFAFAN